MYGKIFGDYCGDFFGQLFTHLDEERKQRKRDEYGITNENGYDGVTKFNIPHEYNNITVKDNCYYCEFEGLLTVYSNDRKLFTSNDIKYLGQEMYLVKIIDEEIIADDWGYALYRNSDKLTEDIFKPHYNYSTTKFNDNGYLLSELADEDKVIVVLNKKGEIIYKEQVNYSSDISLHGVIIKNKKGYFNILTNKYICKTEYYSSDKMSNGECLFVKTEDTCIYQINTSNGEFILHGKEKEKEKPFSEAEQKEYNEKLAASKKLLAEREQETSEWRMIGRNDPCKCGSGKKFKKCCILKWKDNLRKKFNKSDKKEKL